MRHRTVWTVKSIEFRVAFMRKIRIHKAVFYTTEILFMSFISLKEPYI